MARVILPEGSLDVQAPIVVTPGLYNVRIKNVNLKKSKAGNDMIVAWHTFVDEDNAKEFVEHFVLSSDPSSFPARLLMCYLRTFGIDCEGGEFDTDDLQDAEAEVKIGVDSNDQFGVTNKLSLDV